MVRHIVMWKLDASHTTDEKTTFITGFSEMLSALPAKLDIIKNLNINANSANAPENNFDLVLDTTFESFEDLNIYATHPDHMECVKFAKQYKMERSCVDYEF